MAKTYLDQIIEYPGKIIMKLAGDKTIASLLVNKKSTEITEDDVDLVLDERIFDYQYIDDTADETAAYIWVEIDIPTVSNSKIKNLAIYVDIACHKKFMKLNGGNYPGLIGNRRDNLVRSIDKILNGSEFMGIGKLSLESVRTISPINNFVVREITYRIPDFNIVDLKE